MDGMEKYLIEQQGLAQEEPKQAPLSEMNIQQVQRLIDQRLANLQPTETPEEPIEQLSLDPPQKAPESPNLFSPGLSTDVTAADQNTEPEPSVDVPEVPEEQATTLDLDPVINKAPAPVLTWFASSPQKGLFYGRRLERDFLAKQTVYKITIDKEDPTKASFTLVDDEPTIRLAMNIPDSYILPAMELHGPGKIAEAKQIGPVEPGALIKEGDNWRIVRKGILHYQ